MAYNYFQLVYMSILKDKINIILEAYMIEADNTNQNANNAQNNQNQNNNTNANVNTNQNNSNNDEFDAFFSSNNDTNNLDKESNTKKTVEQIKVDLTKLQLLNRLKSEILFYTRLKTIIFSSPSIVPMVKNKLINDLEEIDLMYEYILLNFKRLQRDVLVKIMNLLTSKLNEILIYIKENLN